MRVEMRGRERGGGRRGSSDRVKQTKGFCLLVHMHADFLPWMSDSDITDVDRISRKAVTSLSVLLIHIDHTESVGR